MLIGAGLIVADVVRVSMTDSALFGVLVHPDHAPIEVVKRAGEGVWQPLYESMQGTDHFAGAGRKPAENPVDW